MNDHRHAGTPAEHEASIRTAYERLPERKLAEFASSALAEVLDDVCERETSWDPSDGIRLTAAVVGGIRAFRAVRAGMAIIATGYELEADAMSRVLLELFVETQAAVQDASGETARAWLTGKRARGISSRVKDAMPERPELYGLVSRAAHGDPRALMGLAVTDGSTHTVEWGPRQTAGTARTLIGFAIGARDMAVLLEQAAKREFAVVEALDTTLANQVLGWRPDAAWGR